MTTTTTSAAIVHGHCLLPPLNHDPLLRFSIAAAAEYKLTLHDGEKINYEDDSSSNNDQDDDDDDDETRTR